ncbi:hypothetical protein ASPZODRAFT_127098 [Penicilliopsis zonata CBS 506.65]|uniref:ubiquitinyl hydrolase 1 n=1 Tax=Penicilliopsis zonata CBS 506.65 TaxID=1073090 RepID=A0A1L9SVE5_9EURO|nr:hypothetical protein ASPZODRAFT_127098 [Penicilliopsis zonata CBS 506.65]OJJ51091.1 hypothetical protein ASPZODRAFT_127098 [Penicilliopsis zonata CBS 506.65]
MNARTERPSFLLHDYAAKSKSSSYHELVIQQLYEQSTWIYILLSAILAHSILGYFSLLPFSVPQALWSLVVFLTPSRVVIALDSKSATPASHPMTFHAKSEAMQRILGLNSGGGASGSGSSFYSFLPRARSLSGLGTVFLGAKDHNPPGLGNWDNSCYQNSVIQGLASLRTLADFLCHNLETLAGKGSFATHHALKGIIEQLNSTSAYSQKLWIPPDLKSMSSWQQQDAQEYFSKIIDQVDREVQQATKGQTKNQGLKMAGPEEHIFRSSAAAPMLRDGIGNPSSPRNPLEGLLAQRVGCMNCGWTEGLSLIPFNCLTVPLGGSWEYDIRECLDHYMSLEPIEGVECAKCTLLRTRNQLLQLLKQVEEDQQIRSTPESSSLSHTLQESARTRLQAVEEALADEDFSEKTLFKKCHIPAKSRVCSTKSRQAVIARAPQCLVVHINRSVFDENTGMLRKNYADVRFPKLLNLDEWCLGTQCRSPGDDRTEMWATNPQESMLPDPGSAVNVQGRCYELRAVVTHYGRHENGHYICYRKYPTETFPVHVPDSIYEADGEKDRPERWYRLSDDDVQMVSERSVMTQGGVFMLFYEATNLPFGEQHRRFDGRDLADLRDAGSGRNSAFETPEDNMSLASTATDGLTQDDSESTSSQSTSISPPSQVVPSLGEISGPQKAVDIEDIVSPPPPLSLP